MNTKIILGVAIFLIIVIIYVVMSSSTSSANNSNTSNNSTPVYKYVSATWVVKGGKTVDITSAFGQYVNESTGTLLLSQLPQGVAQTRAFGVADPAVNVVKTIVLTYTKNGQNIIEEIPDNITRSDRKLM